MPNHVHHLLVAHLDHVFLVHLCQTWKTREPSVLLVHASIRTNMRGDERRRGTKGSGVGLAAVPEQPFMGRR